MEHEELQNGLKEIVVQDHGFGTDGVAGAEPVGPGDAPATSTTSPESPPATLPPPPQPHHDDCVARAVHMGLSWVNMRDAFIKYGPILLDYASHLKVLGKPAAWVENIITHLPPAVIEFVIAYLRKHEAGSSFTPDGKLVTFTEESKRLIAEVLEDHFRE